MDFFDLISDFSDTTISKVASVAVTVVGVILLCNLEDFNLLIIAGLVCLAGALSLFFLIRKDLREVKNRKKNS